MDETSTSSVRTTRTVVSRAAAAVTSVVERVPWGTPAGTWTSTTKWVSPPLGGINSVWVMTAPSKMLPSPLGSDHTRTVQPRLFVGGTAAKVIRSATSQLLRAVWAK